ncbi:MAG: TetR/AcrR family transcriptional regulator [Treponema sp.]|jgi:AcrR family transcriptional regulator|nr:TetR/AcrR family transcriptional regulator [Treponema sp.]
MAAAVEHDKRRKKILEKALAVFKDDGFENATFQKIADKCGITRTILYLYFKNKKEIFNYSIKQVLLNLEEKLKQITSDDSLGSVEKITKVYFAIFKQIEHNRQLLSVVLDYLLHLSRTDVDPEKRVRRRTVKLRHILLSMLIEGIKSGELKKVNIKTTADYLNSFVETAIYQIVVLKRENLDELRDTVVFAVELFSNPGSE